MRLIDADAWLRETHFQEGIYPHTTLKKEIEALPTIEAEPVKHGEWIEKPFLLGTSNFCSLCDSFYGMPHGKFKYCPNCGAKMDLEG